MTVSKKVWISLLSTMLTLATYYTLSAYIKWEDSAKTSNFRFYDNASPQSGSILNSQVGTTDYKRVSVTFNSGNATISTCRFECDTDTASG